MAKIIINADDFGMNPTANSAIEKALKDDVITSTTIMANTETPDVVMRVYNELKDTKSFGAHLNLTQGKCLTNSAAFHRVGLVDDDNCFALSPRKVEWTDDLLKAVYLEWEAQIRKIKSMGITISHIDGHHHSHNIPGLQPVLFDLCHNEGINKIRSIFYRPIRWRINLFLNRRNGNVSSETTIRANTGVSGCAQASNKSAYLNHISAIYNEQMWKRRVRHAGILTTECFGSYKTFYDFIRNGNSFHKNDIVELMCHPGAESTAVETSLLSERALDRYIANIEYINYNQL